MSEVARSLEELAIAGVDGDPLRLEELIDRRALAEMLTSFERHFGVPIRVLASSGATLAGSDALPPVCALVNAHPAGQQACAGVLTQVRKLDPARAGMSISPPSATVPRSSNELGVHRCFTGAAYRVIPIEYDRRSIGRILLGPYLPADQGAEPPASLGAVDPELDAPRARAAWAGLPRATEAAIENLGNHLGSVLDVVLFSGHKALLTSQMHLASMRESYRELCEKNERLEEAYERLKELDRLKSNFLATVSHELRTPLTSIMGYGEMLAEGVAGELNDEQREFVATIRTKSEQLLGLIMSLLDLSKLESGTAAMRVTRLPIEGVLSDTVSTLTPTAMKKGVELSFDAPPDLPPVVGDVERLRQVFLNLAENAVKFTPPNGSVRLVARMAYEQPEGEPGLILVAPLRQVVEVRVMDTGIGIAESERDKVFDPFYQIDQSSTREYGGAGLGLAIVKRLVEAHQGSIHVEGNDPHGAVFVVALPAGRPSVFPQSRRTLPPILG
jgi:two-component system, NarL family, sensor histidine kinase BarA